MIFPGLVMCRKVQLFLESSWTEGESRNDGGCRIQASLRMLWPMA